MREEQIGECRLILGDCREVLPTLGKVDAVVTDPPYGVREDDWDNMDPIEFARFSMQWMALAHPLAPELATFCTQDSAIIPLARMLYPRVRQLLWHKPPGSQYPGGREARTWFTYEPILHCYTPSSWSVVEAKSPDVGRILKAARETAGMSRTGVDIAVRGKKTGLCFRWEEGACLPTAEQIIALQTLLPLGQDFLDAFESACAEREKTKERHCAKSSEEAAGYGDVFSHRTVTNGSHPCEKPVPLLQNILESIGSNWNRVVDPFMGSGSTAVACIRLGRGFIGIERDQTHFATACRRIEQVYRQPDLFREPPAPKPEQLVLA